MRRIDVGPDDRVIFLLIGPPGSGKTHFVSRMVEKMTHRGIVPSVHSLDDCRILCNGGTYPKNKWEHDRVNQLAIPQYRESVMRDEANVVILDNTHLKFDPDWQLALDKARRQDYDVFPILPTLSEYFLVTNRSTHLGDDEQTATDTYLKMCARWFGHRLRHVINRRIASSVLEHVLPSTPDSFSINKMWHVKYGTGHLYVLDNYLGYIDRDMIIYGIKAGNHLKRSGMDEDFLKKDSLLHVTLIPPGRMHADKLKTLAIRMADRTTPPSIRYTGIHMLERDENRVLFLTIADTSNEAWRAAVASPAYNPDGIHVTLGFNQSDIWGVNKTIDRPTWTIHATEWNRLPDTYEWIVRRPLTIDNVDYEMGYVRQFRRIVRAVSQNPPVIDVDGNDVDWNNNVPLPMAIKIGRLSVHPDVSLRWKRVDVSVASETETAATTTIHLLNVQVQSRRRFLPDDESYRRHPFLRHSVPRGLTFIFNTDRDDASKTASKTALKTLIPVFPTPKFFGDNDMDEDVEVMSDEQLYAHYADVGDSCIVTEKANGEMFTFTVVDKKSDDKFTVVMGSKNNKFPFVLKLADDPVDRMGAFVAAVDRLLMGEGKPELTVEHLESSTFTHANLWVEMCYAFSLQLHAMRNIREFLTELFRDKLTLCGEFESWLHPHLVAFPHQHRKIRFFGATTYDENYSVATCDALDDIARLVKLEAAYRIDLVDIRERMAFTPETLVYIKEETRNRRNSEGIVLLILKEGRLVDRVKIKTIWYVVHRGFREKIRKILAAATKNKLGVAVEQVEMTLRRTLEEKLKIFKMSVDDDDAESYVRHVKQLSRYVAVESKTNVQALFDQFTYDYPRFMEEAAMCCE